MAFRRGGAVTFNVTKQAQQFRLKVVFRAQKKKKGKFVKSGALARKAKIGFGVVVWHAFVRVSFVQ